MIRWLFLFIVCKSKHYSSVFTLCAQAWISLSGVSRWSPPLESNCTCISQAVATPGQAFFMSLMTWPGQPPLVINGTTVLPVRSCPWKKPTHVLVDSNPAFEEPSMILLEQIFTIDKSRIERFMGYASKAEMLRIDMALLVSLALNVLSGNRSE